MGRSGRSGSVGGLIGRGAGRVWLGLAAMALALTACGGVEGIAQNAAEQAIEQSADGDVDVDFSGDGLNIQTEDGAITFDSETGAFVVTDENGEVTSGNVAVDGEGFNISTEDGSLTFDGATGTLTGNDGESMTMQSGVDQADDWPQDIVPLYPNATVIAATSFSDSSQTSRVVALGSNDETAKVWKFYNDATQGWEGTRAESNGGGVLILTGPNNASLLISITPATSGDAKTDISITLSQAIS